MSSFRGLVEVIERHGLLMELYTDRGSHYFHTPEAGGKVSKTQLTQVGRALKQLGDSLPSGRQSRTRGATSQPTRRIARPGWGAGPQPRSDRAIRGRCERAFRTLEDRLPKELTLAGITTVEAANRFIREVYLGEHNGRFAVPADEPASAFVQVPAALWRDVLCIQEERRVGNDNCVRWHGRSLQIPPTPLRPHLVRASVRVHDYPDGSLAIFKGPHRLARFPPAAPVRDENLAA